MRTELRRSKSYQRTHIDYRGHYRALSQEQEAKREAIRLDKWRDVVLRAADGEERR